jgi:hypothetical protein
MTYVLTYALGAGLAFLWSTAMEKPNSIAVEISSAVFVVTALTASAGIAYLMY